MYQRFKILIESRFEDWCRVVVIFVPTRGFYGLPSPYYLFLVLYSAPTRLYLSLKGHRREAHQACQYAEDMFKIHCTALACTWKYLNRSTIFKRVWVSKFIISFLEIVQLYLPKFSKLFKLKHFEKICYPKNIFKTLKRSWSSFILNIYYTKRGEF